MKHQAMQISKAQVQQHKKQHKKVGIFDLLKVIAIFGAIYIAYQMDNPFVCFGLIGVMFFIINNSQDFKDYRDVVDSATPYILSSDKAGRVPSIFIGDRAADVFEN